MLGNAVRSVGDRFVPALVSSLARAGMRPAGCHACEVLAAVVAGVSIYLHQLPLATALFLAHGFFDYLDGALRRREVARGTDPMVGFRSAKACSPFAERKATIPPRKRLPHQAPSLRPQAPGHAEKSHAMADKLSEVAIYLGIALGQYAAWWLAVTALAASLATTWVGFAMLSAAGLPRSRALFDRADRMLVLLVFLAVAPSPALLCLILGMSCATLLLRLRLPLAREAAVPQPDAKGT